MGEAKIDTGIGAIFNMTPSPGGTSCVENAEIDMRTVARFLNASVDDKGIKRDLLGDDIKHNNKDFPGYVISDEDAR
jgi:malate dehydrogenase (quinone)